MSDFLKKLKGVFVVEDPNAPAASAKPQSTATPAAASQQSAPTHTPTPSVSYTSGSGKANDKFLEVLFKAMETANAPGYDYFEFKQALNNLKNVPMDDVTRFKSAFAMAQTMGATKDALLNTAGGYLKVLQQEQAKFQDAANNQMQGQVGNKNTQITNFDAAIKQKQAEIQRMTAEIEQHRKEMETLKQDISQSTAKVSQTIADFEATYTYLVSQIQGDVNSMKQYL
jgi:hypothetical protein